MTMLHGLVDCLCRSHCMIMYWCVCTSALSYGHLKDKFEKNPLMVFTNRVCSVVMQVN